MSIERVKNRVSLRGVGGVSGFMLSVREGGGSGRGRRGSSGRERGFEEFVEGKEGGWGESSTAQMYVQPVLPTSRQTWLGMVTCSGCGDTSSS